MKKSKLLVLAAFATLGASATQTPLWMRDVRIAPDGKTIAFCYSGDIYTVPVTGGEAKRLTTLATYESVPVWSPDSRQIAFASDRSGSQDIYIVPATGGEPLRLTNNGGNETPEAFTPDGKAVIFSAAIQDPATSALFPTGRMTEVFTVATDGKTAPRQILATPAQNISWLPGGKTFLYQDVKGFEDTWRKHHTSSVTRDIWKYDIQTGKHSNLTARAGEDLNPVAGTDGSYYFLSERNGGTMNVYRSTLSDPAKAEALTGFKTHPVRFLSRAADGMLCFTWDGSIYTLADTKGAKPQKVKITLTADQPDQTRNENFSSGHTEAVVSPDGKQVAFVRRGDVFVTSTDYKTTKQISATPEAERHLTWANDSTLLYVSERNGQFNIFQAAAKRSSDDEPDLTHATLIDEKPLFGNDGHERTSPKMSPDGKTLAFILDRNKLAVLDMASKKVRVLTDGSTNRSRGGSFYYTWSPDSRWIAMEIVDRRHDPYTDVAIVNVADATMTNLTNSGYFDSEPKWVLDGNALAFISERYGMRNHASWGSMTDVMLVFMNQDALDRFRLSKEDAELRKTLEEKREKAKKDEDTKDKKKDKKDKKEESKNKEAKEIKVETAGISDRQVRLTPISLDLSDQQMSKDGKKLYYLSQADDGMYLWTLDLEEDELDSPRKISGARAFQTTADGKDIFILGKTLRKMTSPGSYKTISYSGTQKLDPAAERRYMFDYVEREERERFYTKDMHGVDWKKMCADYRRFLPHINNNYDFAELLSELLGELNVSHTGARFYGISDAAANPEPSATLGALYDLKYDGPGMKIAEVLEQGPLHRYQDLSVTPGMVITKINGEEITVNNPLETLLKGTAGKRTLVTIRDKGGKEHELVLKPANAGLQNSLLYKRWVKQRAAAVDSLSNGRLGYVHIPSMDDDSFREVYSQALGKYNDREGLVIDIRWNGGGRLHEDIEVLFSGKKYFTQEIRGNATCDMPSRRWNKPSIMVMAEPCYSNAHGTPWVYKHQGLGKLVGMPVPGTMTSVNWVTMQDPTLVFGIPVVGYRLADGTVLENQQLEPDIKVANAPEDIVRGHDAQIEAAVRELLRQIDSK